MRARALTGLVALLFVTAGVVSAPAAGDWLVLRDGTGLEIDGAWEVRGKLVLFTRQGGQLSSLRLSEVDLEASHRRTAEAAMRPAEQRPEPSEPVEPVLVLTDADVRHVAPASAAVPAEGEAEAEPKEASAGGPPAAPASESGLRVTSWDVVTASDYRGTQLGGTLVNESDTVALNVVLTVVLKREDGRLAGRARADIVDRALAPGQSTRFIASFSGIYGYETAEFEPRSFDAVKRTGDSPE